MLCAWLAVQVRGRKLLIWYTGIYVLATNRLGVRRVSNLSVSFGLGFLGLGLMLWLVELEMMVKVSVCHPNVCHPDARMVCHSNLRQLQLISQVD